RTRNFHASHSFEFGARTRDYGYWPRTQDEIDHWFKVALRVARRLACSDHPNAAEARTLLARFFSDPWMLSGLVDELEAITRELSQYQWQEGWIGVRKTLSRQKTKMIPDSRRRLEALELLLRPNDLVSRTRAVVLTETWGPLDFADADAPD